MSSESRTKDLVSSRYDSQSGADKIAWVSSVSLIS